MLQRLVKKLHFGSWEEKEAAAKEIERMAKEDVKARTSITELGVVPVLVSMVASEVAGCRKAGLKALLQLGSGNYTSRMSPSNSKRSKPHAPPFGQHDAVEAAANLHPSSRQTVLLGSSWRL